MLIYYLAIEQVSPSRAGAYAAAAFVPVWILREWFTQRRIVWRPIVDALEESSRSAVMIAAACAIVGVIMNVTDLTGLGLKFTSLILSYSGGSLFVLLLLTAVAAILLGTGLPTTATYLIVAILVAPALAKMGVPLLAAHLFVFYFGVISDLTPPTAVSCYVAAGIAKDSGMRVSFSATRIALPALIVPFMFVYSPELLLKGSAIDIVLVMVPTLIGLLAVSVALIGYLSGPLRPWQRALAFAGGVLLIFPGWATNVSGIALVILANAQAWLEKRRATA